MPSSPTAHSRNTIKIFVSLGLLGAVLLRVHPLVLVSAAARMPWTMVLAVLVLAILQVLVTSLRWHLMLRAVAIRLPVLTTIEANIVSILAGLFLFNAVGGTVGRIGMLAKAQVPVHKVLSTTILEKLMILGVLAVMGLAGLAALHLSVAKADLSLLWMVLPCLAVGLAAALAIGRLFEASRDLMARIMAYLRRMMVDFRLLAARGSILAAALALTAVSQGLLLAIAGLAAAGLGVAVPMTQFLLLMPVTTILSSLPISLAGFGVREVSLVMILGAWGVPAEQALVLSLVIALSTVLGAAIAACAVTLARTVIREPS